MQTNCSAYAKVVVNKKLGTFRLLVTFDSSKNATNLNAAYKSGDMCNVAVAPEVYAAVVAKEVGRAKSQLRVSSLVF